MPLVGSDQRTQLSWDGEEMLHSWSTAAKRTRGGQRDCCLGKWLSQLLPQEQGPLRPHPCPDKVQHPKGAYVCLRASQAAHQGDAGNIPQLCTHAKNSPPTPLSRAESHPAPPGISHRLCHKLQFAPVRPLLPRGSGCWARCWQ